MLKVAPWGTSSTFMDFTPRRASQTLENIRVGAFWDFGTSQVQEKFSLRKKMILCIFETQHATRGEEIHEFRATPSRGPQNHSNSLLFLKKSADFALFRKKMHFLEKLDFLEI